MHANGEQMLECRECAIKSHAAGALTTVWPRCHSDERFAVMLGACRNQFAICELRKITSFCGCGCLQIFKALHRDEAQSSMLLCIFGGLRRLWAADVPQQLLSDGVPAGLTLGPTGGGA